MEKLTALRIFRRVVELKSFTRAARDLRLSNAAVSKNVRELEAALGAPLIQRTTRQLNVTVTGEAYYLRVVAILDELADADRSVTDSGSAPRGILRVSAPMSLGLTRLVPAVSSFALANEQIRIDLELNDRLVDVVREGFDLAIRGGTALPDSTLVSRRLSSIERVLVASPDYLERNGTPSRPNDLTKHRCLVYSGSATDATWPLVKGAASKVVAVGGPIRVNSSLALVQAACGGLGIALVPLWTTERELANGSLVRVLPEWEGEVQALYAVYPRHREISRSLRAFVDHLAKALRRPLA